MRERDVERYFRKAVQARGGQSWKFVSPAHRGVADRIALLPGGATWFVELKAPTGRLSALQKLFAEEVEALGGKYACLWTKEDVDAWLSH